MPRACTWSMAHTRFLVLAPCLVSIFVPSSTIAAADADLILHHGKIVTVDRDFSIRAGTGRQGRPDHPGRLR